MTGDRNAPADRLLRTLAEQLKLPLLQIARTAELGKAAEANALESIAYTADMAMRLIDSYLLSMHLQGQQSLALEPVSISSLLHDVAERLQPLASSYGQDIEVSLGGKYAPVMAHREALEAAFVSLGYAMLDACSGMDERGTVVLGARRGRGGITAGIFGAAEGLTTDMYKRARSLYGRSRQPLPAMKAGNGAGVFVADALLSSMEAPLRVAHHHKLSGFATTLLPSQQLQLV